MSAIKYYIERVYPYILALAVSIALFLSKTNFTKSQYLVNALDAVITMAALIIGFLGAVLPVIMGMKNESKFVKYVFEKDKNRLFLKYIKVALSAGLMLVFMTVCMYFINDIPGVLANLLFYIWAFLVILFLICTYRCLKNMLNLIFSQDSSLENPMYKGREIKSAQEKQLENKYKR